MIRGFSASIPHSVMSKACERAKRLSHMTFARPSSRTFGQSSHELACEVSVGMDLLLPPMTGRKKKQCSDTGSGSTCAAVPTNIWTDESESNNWWYNNVLFGQSRTGMIYFVEPFDGESGSSVEPASINAQQSMHNPDRCITIHSWSKVQHKMSSR